MTAAARVAATFRDRRCWRRAAVAALLCAWLFPGLASTATLEIDDATARALGERIYRNETGGDPEKLLWWNRGEDFPSLGIGHFIWYPEARDGPFVESFPGLLRFLSERGVALPEWLEGDPDCPWPDRSAFEADRDGKRATELRALLEATVDLQSRYIVDRLSPALGRIVESFEAPSSRARIRGRIDALAATPHGLYALVDYVNFKGDGLRESERYAGEGWGLRQVLDEMSGDTTVAATDRFADAATAVLARRVRNAPAERRESRWLPGWKVRTDGYRAP